MSFPVFRDRRQPEVHASTILLFKNRLLCAWFGGTKEGHADTKIWLSVKPADNEDGDSWSPPRIVCDANGVAHWNPVLFKPDGEDRILLFYKTGSPISSWSTQTKESLDGGESWSGARELVKGDKGGRGPVKNKPMSLPDGKIVAPGSIETASGVWECFTDSSADGGKTWTKSSTPHIDRSDIPGEGSIQPSLIWSGEILTMLTRSSSGFVLRADSKDEGRTWSSMYRTPLYNNNSGLDAIRLDSGIWLVVHNPVQQRWGPRTPLVISSSVNEGCTWKRMLTLEDKPPPVGFKSILAKDTGIVNDGASEFSYPAIISDGNGGVFITYTYERVGIKFVHVTAGLVS